MRYLTFVLMLIGLWLQGQQLQEYQQLALEQNPALQAKYKDFEAAMQRVSQVRGLPDPTLSVSAFGRMTETRVGPQMARFTLSQMFPWFGTLRAQGEMTTLMAEASFQRFVDEQNKIRFQVAKAYYPLVELEQLVEIQKASLSVLKSWKTLATAKYENGQTTLVDVLRVDLMIQEMETEITLLETMKRPLTVTFNNLLNREDTIAIKVESQVAETPVYVETDWSEHPLLQELDLKIQSKEKQRSVIEKQSLPKLGVGLDYIIVAERTDMNVPGNGQDAIMPMVTVSLPIFRKKYKSALSETSFQSEGYTLMRQSTQNELENMFENLKYDIQKENNWIDLYRKQAEKTEQIQRLLLSEFSNSGKDLVELLRVQMQLLSFQKNEVKAKTRLLTALANLDYVLAAGN
jgi:cobalt-zinc-cadmium efflux system outer membrane protein